MELIGSRNSTGRLWVTLRYGESADFNWHYLRNYQGDKASPLLCPCCDSSDIYSLKNEDELGYPPGNWWWCHTCKAIFKWTDAQCVDCHATLEYVDPEHASCPKCKTLWELSTIKRYYSNNEI